MSSIEISVPVIRTRTRRERLRARGVRAVETARQGLRQLAAHRMRTALALTGIVVGVATVVGSLALLDGVKGMVLASFEKLGGTQVGMLAGRNGTWSGGRWIPFQKQYLLTPEDFSAMAAVIPQIEQYSPMTWGNTTMVAGHNRMEDVGTVGVGANYLDIRPATMVSGRFFTGDDDRDERRVVVLFEALAQDLFGRSDVAGEELLINGQRFTVAGVSRQLVGGRNFGRRAYVPFGTAMHRLGRTPESVMAWIKVRSGVKYDAQQAAFLEVQVRRHPGSKPENFRVRSIAEFQGNAMKGVEVQGKVLIAVALLCLLASGVGIMNVFLISVTERTAEIGLRLALGASRRAVLGQFLFEALLLCALGGAAGILAAQGVAGLFAAIVAARTSDGLFANGPLPVALGLKGIALGLSLATLIALLFGSYPAWRASRLDPATSLRHE